MKIPKVLTICFVLCCLFAGNVFAVSEPCVDITKEACPYSKVGDGVIYTITIENCGDIELEVVDVLDSLLGPLGPGLCPILVPGESCQFDIPYLVQAGDPDPLINEVTVEAVSSDGTPVADTSTMVIDLLHPELVVDVECLTDGIPVPDATVPINGGTANFEVCLTNTGDVALDVSSNTQSSTGHIVILGDRTLAPGETYCTIVSADPVGGVCGGGEVTLTAYARATIPPEEFCDLPDLLQRSDSDTCEIPSCEPDFTVEKTCLTSPAGDDCALRPGDMAQYEIVITNTGTYNDLDFQVEDPGAIPSSQAVGPLQVGESATLLVEVPVPDCPSYQTECVDLINAVTVEGFCDLTGESVGIVEAVGVCEYSCFEPEGCTPGFWKNHPDCWCPSYTEAQPVSDVFTRLSAAPYDSVDDDDRKSDFDSDTLADALRYRGGPGLAGSVRNMLRHATAALLNGCGSDVAYPISDQVVIELVNWVLDQQDIGTIHDAHILLAMWNEDSPCPIDAHCRRIDDEVNGD